MKINDRTADSARVAIPPPDFAFECGGEGWLGVLVQRAECRQAGAAWVEERWVSDGGQILGQTLLERGRFDAGRGVHVGAIVRCAGNQFAYLPRNHTQGRAGESSPALLHLGFALDAFHLWKGEADAAAEHGCFDFTRFAPAAQCHGSDFPACGQISGGEEGGRGIGVLWSAHSTRKVPSFSFASPQRN